VPPASPGHTPTVASTAGRRPYTTRAGCAGAEHRATRQLTDVSARVTFPSNILIAESRRRCRVDG
jgi:hypothetical protein